MAQPVHGLLEGFAAAAARTGAAASTQCHLAGNFLSLCTFVAVAPRRPCHGHGTLSQRSLPLGQPVRSYHSPLEACWGGKGMPPVPGLSGATRRRSNAERPADSRVVVSVLVSEAGVALFILGLRQIAGIPLRRPSITVIGALQLN